MLIIIVWHMRVHTHVRQRAHFQTRNVGEIKLKELWNEYNGVILFSNIFFRVFAVYKEQFPEGIFLRLPFNLWGLLLAANNEIKFVYCAELFDMNKYEGYWLDFITRMILLCQWKFFNFLQQNVDPQLIQRYTFL